MRCFFLIFFVSIGLSAFAQETDSIPFNSPFKQSFEIHFPDSGGVPVLPDTLQRSRERAITIARKKGCYRKNDKWLKKEDYDQTKKEWMISSTRWKPKGKYESKQIIRYVLIDARSGHVVKKDRNVSRILIKHGPRKFDFEMQ